MIVYCVTCLIVLLIALYGLFSYFDFPYKLILGLTKFEAIIHPWKHTIFWDKGLSKEQKAYLLPEEQAHIRQAIIYGGLLYSVIYIYYNVRYGYENNPFEIDAKQQAREVRKNKQVR